MQGSPLNPGGNGGPAGPPRRRYDDPPPSAPPDPPLNRKERQLRFALLVGAVFFAIEAAIYVPDVFGDSPESRPFAINSVAKDVLFAALTALAAVDLRRLSRLLGLVILGHVVILLLLGILLIFGPTDTVFPPPQWLAEIAPFTDIEPDLRLIFWLVGCLAATAVLVWLYGRALRERYDLRYLWAPEHETVAALADAVLERPAVPPREIATAVDHYWDSLDVEYKFRLRGALWAVLLSPLPLKPPLPLMERGRRQRFIREHLLLDEPTREGTKRLPMLLQSSVRFTMQMVYSAYYNDRRSYAAVGYERFSERPNYPGDPPEHRGLRTIDPATFERWSEQDVVVIGTGAGGAMVARELVRKGRRVLMLERGLHIERDRFVEDEALMYARLYSDGALQTSRDFTFQVLQGMCVGGTTVVNNGVSFNIPEEILDVWNAEHDAGLPKDELDASFEAVRKIVKISEQGIERGNPIAKRLNDAEMLREGSKHGSFLPVEANLHECYGCGYCNIGCRFGKKLSMLDGVLPETQQWADEERRKGNGFEGRLEILPRCRVTKLLKHDKRVTGVQCALRLSDEHRQEIEISADTVVLSAGAIHSSRLLMQSGIGGPSVGTELSANLGAHITADFGDQGDPIRAFDGLQMSHYLKDGKEREHLIETWFNPVMSQALVMPGWIGHHQRNMERYERMGALGVLVGSEPNGHRVLRRRHLFNGSEVDFTPSANDIKRVLRGLREAGEILLEAGARHVMPLTFRYHELRTTEDLDDLENGKLVQHASDISINTGHPQGGNAMSGRDGAVVDQRFRVRDCENLYLVDASVFPTAINVNPQLTVMALAHRAGSRFIT